MPLATMDALSDILKTIQLSANTYFCRGFGSHWNMQIRHRPQGLFHVVTAGQCYLREESTGALMLLTVGDIVAFPTGGGHWISDCSDSQDSISRVRYNFPQFFQKLYLTLLILFRTKNKRGLRK